MAETIAMKTDADADVVKQENATDDAAQQITNEPGGGGIANSGAAQNGVGVKSEPENQPEVIPNGEYDVVKSEANVEKQEVADSSLPVDDNAANKRDYSADENFIKLKDQGIPVRVSEAMVDVFESGHLKFDDLDERAIEALKSVREDQALIILKQFIEGHLEHVSNKASYLCSLVKSFKDKIRQLGRDAALSEPLIRGPDETKLKEILDKSGYPLEVSIGQRKYGGPPPDWGEKPAPGAGCEVIGLPETQLPIINLVYVGKLPKEVYETDLIPLFEECGILWDLRLMMDPLTSQNKGYCFITYTNKEDANKAAKKYDDYEIRRGKRLKVNVSIANTRLFIGNIPKSKSKEDIIEEFSKHTEGIVDVIVYPSPDDPVHRKNRGFCFIEYNEHKNASTAKKKLTGGRTKPFNCELVVDWAEQQVEPDAEVMEKVKALYVKNLTPDVTEEMLKEEFSKFGSLEKLRKVKDKDYAFVHFDEREDAIKAMEALNGKEVSGQKWDVTLAKPQMDKQKRDQMIREREMRQFALMRGGRPPGPGFGGGRGMRGGPPMGRGMRGSPFAGGPPRGGPGYGRRPPPVADYGGYAASAYGASGYDDYMTPAESAYGAYDPYYGAAGDEYADYGAAAAGYDAYGAYGADPYDPYAAAAPRQAAYGGGSNGYGGGRGQPARGKPRGAPVGGGRGVSGGPPRGGGYQRGGGGYSSFDGGMKRKANGSPAGGFASGRPNKRARGGDSGAGGWTSRPIAQQPGGAGYYY